MNLNIDIIFRTKIYDGIYSYDIVANMSNFDSCIIGYCIVNVIKQVSFVGVTKSITLSKEQFDKIGSQAREKARKKEKEIYS